MNTFAYIIVFLFGNIIGSFLNVVIYRFNSGKTLGGRSICMSCAKKLSWYELIPVFSFLIQKGKCKGCASKISHQYPMVEIVTGIVFALLAYHFVPILVLSNTTFLLLLIFYVFIFSILIVISVYDIRHKIIPDKLSYTLAFLSFVSLFVNTTGIGNLFTMPNLLDISAGPLFAIMFAMVWVFSKGKLMGLGDAKLALGLGWMLGISGGFAFVTLSFWIGAIFGILMLLFSRKKVGMKTEIPFAPFMILGALIVFLCNLDFMSLARIFSF